MKNNDKLGEILKFLSINTLNFSREIGVTPQQIYDIKSGKIKSITANLAAKIVSRYPEISLNWLLTGKGEMLIGSEGSCNRLQSPTQPIRNGDANGCVEGGSGMDVLMIPILNLDARGGFAGNDVTDTSECFIGQMPFSRGMAQQGDIVMPVYGDSMAPKYPSGSYVLIRPIELWREYLEFGHTYVLGLSDGRRLLKTVQRGTEQGTFALLSFNADYPTQDIPTAIITAVFRVIAMVRQDGM